MNENKKTVDRLLESLEERAKELNCLYRIEELLNRGDAELEDTFSSVVEAIPPGWQYAEYSQVRITLEGAVYETSDFKETEWVHSSDIKVQERVIGTISVYYTQELPTADHGPFLKEELHLLDTIADRLGHFILHNRIKHVYQEWTSTRDKRTDQQRGEWQVVLDLLEQTDKNLFTRLSHKMLNHLCWSGVEEAEELLKSSSSHKSSGDDEFHSESNRAYQKRNVVFPVDLSSEVFRIAGRHITDDEIFSRLQKWIQEDKLGFLVNVVNRNLSLSDVADAIRRYYHTAQRSDEGGVSPAKIGIHVSLIRRFLSDQLQYINTAKKYIDINDFYKLLQNMIYTSESHGKLGGKSAGMFLAAQIIKKNRTIKELPGNIKIPRTWYITSDILLHFMHYNNLEEIVEQKYKQIDEVRFEYPHIVHTFKNSHFPSEIVKGLSVALDDFGDRPLIVRSSSLLEDRMGAAFSGKYKSVFLANQGSKRKRLEALLDAITEVYASTFGPDPIEYRTERELIDFGEEMGIMIQEVVGNQVGDYFLPSFAGVAFSQNEFRWSPRIRREDGLARLVPGLGTRAVDRLSDDYPILCAPGQPGLKVNVSVDDILRYSPRYIDVINLKKNSFETIEVGKLLKKVGYELPAVTQMVSIHEDGHIHRPVGSHVDYDEDDLVVTLDGLISNSPFIKQIRSILTLLEEQMGTPVDIEFAHDGKDLYLLQCRPQSQAGTDAAAPIPKDIPEDKVIFTANRYVSNGRVSDITHIVYIDPEAYGAITNRDELVAVGRAVGRLNKLLPKRQFILMGPGRWGSRGDIKLGVKVTYSDINNTAMLVEIARKKGNYTADLSFGTHFFQDLVEARIRYLPLYPDDSGILFNEHFLKTAPNMLAQILPDHADLADTIRLIDIPSVANSNVLRVLMNAELDEAVGLLCGRDSECDDHEVREVYEEQQPDAGWRWRLRMAEHVASQLDPKRFGVNGFYVFGSTKNATAGASSDIDVLIHFAGTPRQREKLEDWLEGWSLCLDRINYLKTGYQSDGLLDVHIITDKDVEEKSSYAVKIGAATDAARELPMMKKRSRKKS